MILGPFFFYNKIFPLIYNEIQSISREKNKEILKSFSSLSSSIEEE